jgi:hypothetical protein
MSVADLRGMPRTLATVVLFLALAGCATTRNVSTASELLGCSEDAVTEVAGHGGSPQGLYSGCGGTVACLESGGCFVAHRSVDVVPLPGLTRSETALHASLVRALREVEGGETGGSSGVCSGGFSGGGGIGNPGPFAVILLPVLAVGALVAIGCAADNAAQANRAARRKELREEVRAIEDRVHPASPSGCTEQERRQLGYGLALRLSSSVCGPRVEARASVEPPSEDEEPDEAPPPPEPPAPDRIRTPLKVPSHAVASAQAQPPAEPHETRSPSVGARAEEPAGGAHVLDNALRGRR